MNFFNNIYIYIYIYIYIFFLNLIKLVMARPYEDIFSGFTGILKSWKRDNKTTLNNFWSCHVHFYSFSFTNSLSQKAVQIIYVQTIFTYLGCLNKPPFKKYFCCNNVFKKWTINQSTTLSIGLPANKPRGKLDHRRKAC